MEPSITQGKRPCAAPAPNRPNNRFSTLRSLRHRMLVRARPLSNNVSNAAARIYSMLQYGDIDLHDRESISGISIDDRRPNRHPLRPFLYNISKCEPSVTRDVLWLKIAIKCFSLRPTYFIHQTSNSQILCNLQCCPPLPTIQQKQRLGPSDEL